MQNLVSIIIPVYNTEKYVSRCILSVTKQTYPNTEIILIDDGSTDNSLDILLRFQKQHENIKVIKNKNEGAGKARNIGIERSLGKYITFIDSDDWINEQYIEGLVSAIEHSEADIALCGYAEVYNDTIIEKRKKYPPSIIDDNRAFLLKAFQTGDFSTIVPWGKIYNRSIFEGIRFPINTHFEDEATIYKVFFIAKKLVFSKDSLYYYTKRADSLAHATAPKYPMEAMNIFEEKYLFFEQRNELRFLPITLSSFCWSCLNAICKEKKHRSLILQKLQKSRKKLKKLDLTHTHHIRILFFFCTFPYSYIIVKKIKSLIFRE